MGFGFSISAVWWRWCPCIVGTLNKMLIDIDNLPATTLKSWKEAFDG